MIDTGVRLQLMIGPTVPLPVSSEVVDAISSLEVTNTDSGRDGFQMSFTLGKELPMDYGLLLNNYFEPPNRVIIIVIIGGLSQVLIDGIITNHQIAPSNTPGGSTLVVTGEDISLQLDLEDKNETFKNQSDSEIVTTILRDYLTYGLTPRITSTDITRQENDGNTTQQGTDLAFIQQLASRNGFVFYVEPTQLPTKTTAYWGLQNYQDPPQPALTMNMGADTNLESISFSFNALGPATPEITILEPNTKQQIPIPVPSGLRPPLARQPTISLRRSLPRDTANKDEALAALQAYIETNTLDALAGSPYGLGDLLCRFIHNAYHIGQITKMRELRAAQDATV